MSFRGCTLALVLAGAAVAGCAASRGPDEMTDDGLARVPSRHVAGVYRLPGASFVQYRRIMLEPPTISFARDWQKNHPDVSDAEIRRIQVESAKLFRDEFTRELIDRGSYELTDELAADVLIVNPAIQDLDIMAPDVGVSPGERAFTTGPVKLKVTGELRDAATGKLVGRLIIYEGNMRYPFNEIRQANRATNAHDQRIAYAKWARILNEALAVAKVEKPR
ncbi:MAG TPA: hypothetical protein VFU13_06805 [Steroidobacteraceae bacterium]|nr:hypothetical protein [Steroidobacteraceae bacterium]